MTSAGRKGARNPRKAMLPAVIERLAPEEASAILRQLLVEKAALVSDAERLANAMLHDVSCESVAIDVEDALASVHVDLVMERAGRDSYGGYTSPDEAACALLDEALQPFTDDMARRFQLGMEEQALEICKGLVLGLYRQRKESGGAFEYAPDFVAEAAGYAVDAWRRGKRGRKRENLRSAQKALLELAPEWKWLAE